MLRATTKEGYQFVGGECYKVIVMTEVGHIIVRPLRATRVRDYLAIERGVEDWGTQDLISLDDAYEIGLYIAEGYIEQVGNYQRLTMASSESEIIDFLRSRGYRTQKDGIHHRSSSTNILKWVSAGTAYEKEIPDFILNSKRKIVVATLQGMFDGDGHAHKERGTVIYSSVSMKLIRSLQQLLLRFGIVSRTYETASQFGKGLRLDIDGADAELFYEEIGFRLERKQRMRRVLRRRKRIFKDDAVPFQGSRVKRVCYQGKRGQGMPTKYGANPASAYVSEFRSSWRVRRGRKGGKISYEKIRELLEIRSDLQGTKDYDFLSMLLDMRYYWAEVVSIQ